MVFLLRARTAARSDSIATAITYLEDDRARRFFGQLDQGRHCDYWPLGALRQSRRRTARLEHRVVGGPALARRLVLLVASEISLQEGFFRRPSRALEDDDGFSLQQHRMVEVSGFGKGHRI